MALVVKNLPANAGDIRDMGCILGWEDPLEETMATHSSILAWRIPWTEEPSGLQAIRSQEVRHDGSNLACMQTNKYRSYHRPMGPKDICKEMLQVLPRMAVGWWSFQTAGYQFQLCHLGRWL